MSSATVADASPAPLPRWLAVALMVVAAVETLGALSDLPGVFFQYDHPTALLRVAQALIKLKLALAAPLAGAALIYAVRTQPRVAIALLAFLVLVRWALDVPTSLVIHGFALSGGLPGLIVFAQYFIYPLLGLAALALAWRNQRLGIAVVLVGLPPFAGVAMIAAFAIGVAIYGF